MYAIVDIAGQQFKVEKEQKLFVHRLEGKEESNVHFDDVLLIESDGKVIVGTPVIKGAVVTAKILEHLKGDKVLVFKKKRRKGYQTLNGHRQLFTQIVIEKIEEKSTNAVKGDSIKEATPKTQEKNKKETTKTAKKEDKKPVEKKAAAKKTSKPKTSSVKKPATKTSKTEKK